ncbi:lipopolysaccharide biosynthesis protein [Peribacillus muralis]|uniref:lipopolysaccharide biosynthesis protein n=1 Tax=Peribacillus muralis TaxID=264697 RepID=UPI000710692E|nr:flippase [Peribacillus muralis]
MRTRNSLINISFGLGSQVIITALSFFSRTVFINSLGIEYLGINGLLTNILAMLSLAEAGIGSSIIYSLYKPVAKNDNRKIIILMRFYKNAYFIIALIVFSLGLLLMPFLHYFAKDAEIPHVNLIYFIFLINTVLPYFYIHKNSFLNVSQKGYIVTAIYTLSSVITISLKIVVLQYTQDYILYLLIDSVTTIITSIVLVKIVNKMYPFLKEKVKDKLDFETKNGITKNVKAIVLQNIGNYLVIGTDNILISSFISVAAVGVYSNYNMLIEICRNFTYQIFNNLYHSVGNLVAIEDSNKVYEIFNIYNFLNFWLYSFFSICLYNLINPFITIWIGSEFLMNQSIIIILLLIFYERGMRNSISTVKTTAGIFYEDRFVPIFQAVVNLAISIILVKKIGMIGIFTGTLLSTLLFPFWTTPYLVYKKIFNKKLNTYFTKYLYYMVIGVFACLSTSYLCSLVLYDGLMGFCLKMSICIFVPNTIYLLFFLRTDEFKYLKEITGRILFTILSRINLVNKVEL